MAGQFLKQNGEMTAKEKNSSRSTKMIDGVEVTRNGYASNDQWYTQKTFGVSKYVLEANSTYVCRPTVSWTLLVLVYTN